MRYPTSALLFILFFATSLAGLADTDSDQLLARVRTKVIDELKNIPRFVCRQRIERKTTTIKSPVNCPGLVEAHTKNNPKDWRMVSFDRANLDVMLTEGHEMFSWPGAHKFDANSPGDLLPRGFSGAGDFGGFLNDIFSGDPRVQFKYLGACDGPACVRFSYDVPRNTSRYSLKTANDEAITEYEGTFDVDPRTADISQLRVHPIDLHHLDLCELRTTVLYSRAAAGSGKYMIPKSTQRDAYYAEGTVYETRTSYEGCRQFTAESVLKGADDEPVAGEKPSASAPPAAPHSGTTIELRLNKTIDSESNAAGDPVEAVIVKPAFGQAIVRGHILQLEHYATPAVVIRLRFDAIVLNGVEVPITLEPSAPQKHLANTGNFVFPSTKVSLGKNFVTEWVVRPAP